MGHELESTCAVWENFLGRYDIYSHLLTPERKLRRVQSNNCTKVQFVKPMHFIGVIFRRLLDSKAAGSLQSPLQHGWKAVKATTLEPSAQLAGWDFPLHSSEGQSLLPGLRHLFKALSVKLGWGWG